MLVVAVMAVMVGCGGGEEPGPVIPTVTNAFATLIGAANNDNFGVVSAQ